MTSSAISSPVSEGASSSLVVDSCAPVPNRYMRHQSIANRKQTTASPEKIPMNTLRTRKKRSSRKNEPSSKPVAWPKWFSPGSVAPPSTSVPDSRFEWSPKLQPLMQVCDQKQRVVRVRHSSAHPAGLALDIEHHRYRVVSQVRIPAQISIVDS